MNLILFKNFDYACVKFKLKKLNLYNTTMMLFYRITCIIFLLLINIKKENNYFKTWVQISFLNMYAFLYPCSLWGLVRFDLYIHILRYIHISYKYHLLLEFIRLLYIPLRIKYYLSYTAALNINSMCPYISNIIIYSIINYCWPYITWALRNFFISVSSTSFHKK